MILFGLMSGETTPVMDNDWALDAFSRAKGQDAVTPIAYGDNLAPYAEIARVQSPLLLEQFFDAEPGTVEEEEKAREAAIGFMVLTGERLQPSSPEFRNTRYNDEVSNHLTIATIELY